MKEDNTSLDIEKLLEEFREKINKIAELNMSEWSGILKKIKKEDGIFITTANLTDLDSDLLENIITKNLIDANNSNVQKLKNLTSNILKNPDIELKIEKNWFILDERMVLSIINRNNDNIEILRIKKLNNNKFVYFTQLSDYEIKKL